MSSMSEQAVIGCVYKTALPFIFGPQESYQ